MFVKIRCYTVGCPVTCGDWERIYDTQERRETEVWATPLSVGDRLPTMPLRLSHDEFTPVDFEAAYEQSCRDYKVE
ncbi:MAG: hypothetical protein ACRC33_25960 [Gemmataceae bacterium]